MSSELALSIVINISLLIAVSIIYAEIPAKSINFGWKKNIILGVTVGLVGIAIMSYPYNISPGIFYDVRTVLIGISGMFLGAVPTVIAVIFTVSYRVFIGGIGTVCGICTIIVAAVVGLLWHKFRFEKAVSKEKSRILELYITGLLIHIGMLASMFVLPLETALAILGKITAVVLGIYPVGVVIIGILLFRQIDRIRLTQLLAGNEERLRVTLMSVGDGVISADNNDIITLMNPAAEKLTGYTGAVGKSVSSVMKFVDEDTKRNLEDTVNRALKMGAAEGNKGRTDLMRSLNKTKRLFGTIISSTGSKKEIECSVSPIRDDNNNLIGVAYVFRDITKEKRKQSQMISLGYHDSLTGLYNRSFLDEKIKRLESKSYLPLSVIIGDVNGLKLTNDAFGHAAGDQLLRGMAARIKKACRREDIVARWGGDEFIVLLPKTDEKTAESICDSIKANCTDISASKLNFSISLGFDTKTNKGRTIDEVIKSAENYMYRKKSLESSGTRGRAIYTILLALHEKNPREQMHSMRVSELCAEIGRAMGKSQREISELELAGLMHDIGKIAISDRTLNKKGPLTQKEWNEIKRHPEIGYRILSSSNDTSYIAEYVLKHHERLDGKGYPSGIKAGEIPVESRILSIADAYDAMTSERPYREGMTVDEAVRRLRENSGTQFEPQILEIFIDRVINMGSTSSRASLSASQSENGFYKGFEITEKS